MAIWDIKERYDKRRANEVRSDRAIEMGGAVDPASYGTGGSVMLMSSSGTSVDFGDLLAGRDLYGGLSGSNRSRALFYGGEAGGNVRPGLSAKADSWDPTGGTLYIKASKIGHPFA